MSDTNAATNGEKKETNGTEGNNAAGGTESPPVKEMKAVVLNGYGGLKNVRVMKRPEPTVGEGEVLIRVKACGLGFPDLMLRQGAIDTQMKTPFVMGFECAGDVEAVGEGVSSLSVGDRVAALTESRAWAELVSCPAKHAYKIPKKMEYKESVAITTNYIVAHALLFDVGNLRSGQTVLIHSAGGGVGQAVAQLAKTVSNVVVIGTASKHKHETIKDSVTHLLEYTQDYVQEIKKICPDGVDLVLDCLCGDDTNKGYSILKPMGRYVLYGTDFIVAGETKSLFSFAKAVDKVSPLKLYDENKTISGFNLRKLLFQQDRHDYIRSLVETVYKLWEKKKIQPLLDSSWAFEDIPEAMQKMHDRKNVGKITFDPNQEPKPRPPEEEVQTNRRSLKIGSKKEKSDKPSSPEQNDKKTEAGAGDSQKATAADNDKK